MDKLINLSLSNENTVGITERVETLVDERLTFAERVELWVLRWLCCAKKEHVADVEFDLLADKKIKNLLDGDCEFNDLVVMMDEADQLPEVEEPAAPVVVAPVTCRDIVVYDDNMRFEIFREVIGEFGADIPVPPETPEVVTRVRKGWRRRRRVVAYCVVALVNKLRSKYYRLSDTEANRRLAAQYLNKQMKESGFRTVDIHLHVSKAVDWYFKVTPSVKLTAAIRV